MAAYVRNSLTVTLTKHFQLYTQRWQASTERHCKCSERMESRIQPREVTDTPHLHTLWSL